MRKTSRYVFVIYLVICGAHGNGSYEVGRKTGKNTVKTVNGKNRQPVSKPFCSDLSAIWQLQICIKSVNKNRLVRV
jgi:hypothetical protein